MLADSAGLGVGIAQLLLPTMLACADMQRVVVVLVCYLDDSGSHSAASCQTVAGYISTLEKWKRFERRSEKLFSDLNLREPFHAKDLLKAAGQFRGMALVDRIEIARRWFQVASTTVQCGLAVSLPKSKYEAVRKGHKVNQSVSVFTQCFNDVLKLLVDRDDIWGQIEQHGISFVVESGNASNDGLLQWYNQKKREGRFHDKIKSLTFCDKADCRAIQLADFVAYNSWKHAEDCLTSGVVQQPPPLLHLSSDAVRLIARIGTEFTPIPSSPRRRRVK